ncbi:hypothetical protein PACTADRAFT_48996 [Pachysolen tannophilus NRRL Y-2460]|uniref:Phosphoribulokinase/uridine kinase domain-containing protein n=1 Tax=Pachysolen tannophilus NRRL Y-2460 TaxID=669874 RepID=A0A1E4TZS2_PACTA|nr:hypothetical protein PACTADRAFT_48996 [Pachysolen tannophilus NRRL Y-2460]
MDDILFQLSNRIYTLLNETRYDQRLIISISGAPGSNRSTIAQNVVNKVNKIAHNRGFIEHNQNLAIRIPQDGFRDIIHNTRTLIMHDYPSIYNPKNFVDLVEKLQEPIHEIQTNTIYCPSYNDDKEEIVEDNIEITPSIRVIILDGGYTQLKDPIWVEISSYVQERWFVRVRSSTSKKRIIEKYLKNGICNNLDDALKRCEDIDMVKREYIIMNTLMPDLIVDSVED